jgi:hypothetical protein
MTMTRIESRPILAVGLALALFVYVGCNTKQSTTLPPTNGTSKQVAPSTTASKESTPSGKVKLFADWRNLEAALTITGEMFGYLDPCGCTDGQQGGLGRRFDLFERMTEQKIPFVRVDLGSLMKDPAAERGGMDQAKVKFDTALKALSMMKYDAIGLGAEDLKLGIQHTLTVFLNQKDQLRFVCANVELTADLRDAFAGTIRDHVISQAGPYKLGVTSVLDPATFNRLNDPDKSMLEVKPVDSVLGATLQKLEAASDVQILLVQGPSALGKKYAEAYPGFDIVISTSDFDGETQPELVNNGATQLVNVGHKGKHVGVFGFFAPTKGKTPDMKYERISLNGRNYRNAEPMRVLIDEEMQMQLKTLRIVETMVRHANVQAPAGSVYVGAEGCKSCHPNTYARWATTGHGKAYEALINNPKDARRRREYDAECISCHTTGFTYTSGWVSEEKTPYLKGNQCENCHGPASKHVSDPKNQEYRKAIARNAEVADKASFCQKCHDEDNSPHFNFQNYYGKIVHKGMDEYKDPRVFKGMTPEQARAAK